MATVTFLDILRTQVALMQAEHPVQAGAIGRAHALIVDGYVVDNGDGTGQVLASDLSRWYTVNGVCECAAAAHGKGCKHRSAWLLFQHVQRLWEAQADQDDDTWLPPLEAPDQVPTPAVLPEAPASVNVRVTIAGRDVQWTLRDRDEDRLASRLEVLLARYPVLAEPSAGTAPSAARKEEHWCEEHQAKMKRHEGKNGDIWLSHKMGDEWCRRDIKKAAA